MSRKRGRIAKAAVTIKGRGKTHSGGGEPRGELKMFDYFGISPVEAVVFLIIAGFVWGLFALASITKTRPE